MRGVLIYGVLAIVIAIAVSVYINFRAAQSAVPVTPPAPAQPIAQYIPPREWLTTRAATIGHASEWNGRVPAQPGDEVWEFSSPPETWKQEMGTGGKCLLRGGSIIDGYPTIVN